MLFTMKNQIRIFNFTTSIVLAVIFEKAKTFQFETIEFSHEKCNLETCSSFELERIFRVNPFVQPDGDIELLVKFKAVADGYIAFTTSNITNTTANPMYMIILGAYNNKISEIRRSKTSNVKRQVNTPGILSEQQFRGFLIRYNPRTGGLGVYAEGADMALLQWTDPNPLAIQYVSFVTYHNRVIQVAFNCKPKDSHSSITPLSKVCQTNTLTGEHYEVFYNISPYIKDEKILEILIRFKGPSDGHILLTQTASDANPVYQIVLGSNENTQSEIRRTLFGTAEFKINTPGLMSESEFRGFRILFNNKKGDLWVFPEESQLPLLHWVDPNPLKIRYISFSSWTDIVVEVAFNCKPTDSYSVLTPELQRATPNPDKRMELLKDYDRLALPYSDSKVGTTVLVPSMTLTHFTIDEEKQTFELQSWINFSWEDERLKWSSEGNETENGTLHFTPDEVWLPDITLYNNAQPTNLDIYGKTNVLGYSNGTVIWVPPSKFVSYCDLNLRKWPRDTQKCNITLGSWTYHEKEIDMKFGLDESEGHIQKVKILEELSKEDNEWELVNKNNIQAERLSKKYDCCDEHYVTITYEFELQRRSSNYTYTVVLPIVLLSLVNLILFLLPTSSGGRITLGAVNFLILSIFLIFFRSRLPNVDHVPYIVMLYGWNLVLVTVSILTAAIVSNLSRIVGTSSPPQCLRPVYNASLMSVLCLGHLLESSGTSKRTAAANRNSYKQTTRSVEDPLAEDLSKFEGPETKKSEWFLLAATIDRLSFFAYTTITLVLLACFL